MTIDFNKIWLGMENDWYMKNTDTSYPRYNIVENTVAGQFCVFEIIRISGVLYKYSRYFGVEIWSARLATRRTRVNSG